MNGARLKADLLADLLPAARPPGIVAEFKATPSPEDLLALGARVEETPLYVGKWRGKGAKTTRYVLELPYPKAVLYRGRTVSRLTLKVPPSGKAKVERFDEDREHKLFHFKEELKPLLLLAETLDLVEAALEVWQSPLYKGWPKTPHVLGGLIADLVFLKTRAWLRGTLDGPMAVSSPLLQYRDPQLTLEGTLENLRKGETFDDQISACPFNFHDPACDPRVDVAFFLELGLTELAGFAPSRLSLFLEVLEALPKAPSPTPEELARAVEVLAKRGAPPPIDLLDLAQAFTGAEVAAHTKAVLHQAGLKGAERRAAHREFEATKDSWEKAKALGLEEELEALAPLLRLLAYTPSGPSRTYSGPPAFAL